MWHVWIKVFQRFEFASLHDGVHKKAASVALNFGIGQFCIPNVDDGLSQLNGRGCNDAFLSQSGLDVAIIKMRNKCSAEPIGNVGDKKTIFPIAFKTTLAIGILALGIGKLNDTTRFHLYGFDSGDQIFYLSTVCTDVLNSTCSHFARNKRQVFGTIQAFSHALGNHFIPNQTRTATQQHVFSIVFVSFHPHNLRMNDRSVEVAR